MDQLGPVIHTRVQGDAFRLQEPAVFHGGLLVATAGGAASVNVRSGSSVDAAPVYFFRAAASEADFDFLERGIAAPQGIFVDLGVNVDVFQLFYRLPQRG